MPIAQLNPDGSVKIYNSKTGETKDVSPDDLGQYNPSLIGDYYKLKGDADNAATESNDPDPAATAKLKGAISTGLTSAQDLAELDTNKESPGIQLGLKGRTQLLGARTGGLPVIGTAAGDMTPFGKEIEQDLYDVADAILRARTGAAAPPEEIRNFLKAKGFAATDSPKALEEKLNALDNELKVIASSLGVDPNDLISPEKRVVDVAIKESTTPSAFSQSDLVEGQDYTLSAVDQAQDKKKEVNPIVEELTSPSTILSTVGDVAGEVVGVPASVLTGGVVNPVTASGTLAGIGEYAGSLMEGKTNEEALDEAIFASAVSGATPMILNTGAKVLKPALKVPGDVVGKFIGRNLTKTGSSVLESTARPALDRGIDLFDEMGARGLASVSRDEAIKNINTSMKTAEEVIQNGIKEAGNPAVMTAKDVDSIFDNAVDNVLDESDINSINRLRKQVMDKLTEDGTISAEKALELKRMIFKKSSGSSVANSEKFKIAGQINDALKSKVQAAADGLREEEILFYLDKVFRKLKGKEYVQGGVPDFNIIKPIKSALNLAGPENISALGQALEKAGAATDNVLGSVSSRIDPTVDAIKKALRIKQPVRAVLTSEQENINQETSL